jgi:polyferredoxin
MSFFNKFSLLRIKKKENKCTTFCRGHQKDCNRSCPMGMQVGRSQNPSSDAECIMCYECAEACKNGAVECKLT